MESNARESGPVSDDGRKSLLSNLFEATIDCEQRRVMKIPRIAIVLVVFNMIVK